MRTLSSLRSTCQDEETFHLIELVAGASTPFDSTAGLKIIFQNDKIFVSAGFYVLKYEMRFIYSDTGTIEASTPKLVGSNIHNRLFFEYSYIDENDNRITKGDDILLTNSYETLSTNSFRMAGSVCFHIEKDSIDIGVGFQNIEHPNIVTLPKVSFYYSPSVTSFELHRIF